MPTTMGTRASTAWTAEEDQRLMYERKRSMGWGQIQQRWFPTKSANACRKRHERLMSRRAADEWETDKFGLLAKTYWDYRKDIWTMLAERVGAPWEVVEQTCLEKGLNNIRTAANNFDKKQRELHPPPAAPVPSSSSASRQNHLSVPPDMSTTLGGDFLDSGISISAFSNEEMFDAAAALTSSHSHSHPHPG